MIYIFKHLSSLHNHSEVGRHFGLFCGWETEVKRCAQGYAASQEAEQNQNPSVLGYTACAPCLPPWSL